MYGVDEVPFLNAAGINSAALGLGGEVLTAETVAVSGSGALQV